MARYERWSILDSGSYGTVYRAWDSRVERYVAIKQLHRHLALEADFVDRFEREVRTLGRLNHDTIVRVHDIEDLVGPDGGRGLPSIVMEYIDGPTLAQVLARRPDDDRIDRKPLRFSVPIVQELLDALHAAHRLDPPIIHRDIKPGNLMIGPNGLTVLDFGIARAATDRSASGLGAPAYQAPEQVRGGHLSPATDLYAVGGVLYELLTGQLAFDAMTGWGHEPPAPSDVHHRFEPFDDVVRRAMAADPADRYQGAEEMSAGLDEAARAFRRAAAQQPAATEQVPPVEVPQKSSSFDASGRRFTVIGILTILVMLCVALVSSEETGPSTRLWLQNTGDRIMLSMNDESMPAPLDTDERAWRTARDLGSTVKAAADVPSPDVTYSTRWLEAPTLKAGEQGDRVTVDLRSIKFDGTIEAFEGDSIPCEASSPAEPTSPSPGIYLVFQGSGQERGHLGLSRGGVEGERWADPDSKGRSGTSYYGSACGSGHWRTVQLSSTGTTSDLAATPDFVIPTTRSGSRDLYGVVVVTKKLRQIIVPFRKIWRIDSFCSDAAACVV